MHCISPEQLLLWFFPRACCGPVPRTSFSSCWCLPRPEQIPAFGSETRSRPSCQSPARFVHRADVLLRRGRAGMCWKQLHCGEMLALNMHSICPAPCPGRPYLGSGNSCSVLVVWLGFFGVLFCCPGGKLRAICHPGPTPVEHIFQNNK